jgi:hypothetical protein
VGLINNDNDSHAFSIFRGITHLPKHQQPTQTTTTITTTTATTKIAAALWGVGCVRVCCLLHTRLA